MNAEGDKTVCPDLEDEEGDTGRKISQEEEDNLLREDNEKEAETEMEVDSHADDTISLSSGGGTTYGTSRSHTTAAGGGMVKAYSTIRAAKCAAMTVRNIGTGGVAKFRGYGGLLSQTDTRYKACHNINSYKTKRNICSSFNTETLMCTTCTLKGSHTVLFRETEGVDNTNYPPRCFVLTDQTFPAALPANGDGECLKIMRVEDATLQELVNVFLETMYGFSIPAGTVIMLHSTTHLAWMGAAAYAEDFVKSVRTIYNAFGDSVIVLHGIPILGDGSTDSNLIRELMHINMWYTAASAESSRDTMKTRKLLFNFYNTGSMSENESGAGSLAASAHSIKFGSLAASNQSSPVSAALSTPAALSAALVVSTPAALTNSVIVVTPSTSATLGGHAQDGGSPAASLSCAGIGRGSGSSATSDPVMSGSDSTLILRQRMPTRPDSYEKSLFEWDLKSIKCVTSIQSMDEMDELLVICSLIRELNEQFSLDLDEDIETWRQKELEDSEQSSVMGPSGAEGTRYILVGASHATRLGNALADAGECVVSLASPGWKLSEDTVEATAARIRAEAEKSWRGDTILVYQLYDSSVYFSSTRPGEMTLPKKNKDDGKFHIAGKLKMADHDIMKEVVFDSIPLLRAGGNMVKIVLSPLPRYIMGPCCSNPGHVTNHGSEGYAVDMGARLADMCDWLADFLHIKRIKKAKTIFPGDLVGGLKDGKKEMSAAWGRDPVHMSEHGYAKEAEAIRRMAPALIAEFKDPEEDTKKQPESRGVDRSLSRQKWVSSSDATASRTYQDRRDARGEGNSSRYGRGGGGWTRGWASRGRGGGSGRGHSGGAGHNFKKPY